MCQTQGRGDLGAIQEYLVYLKEFDQVLPTYGRRNGTLMTTLDFIWAIYVIIRTITRCMCKIMLKLTQFNAN